MLAVAAPRTDLVLGAVRALSVGAFAGATAIAGHSVTMPAPAPTVGTLVCLLAVCATIGATVGSRARWADSPHALVGILALAQVVGHLTLSIGSAHAIAVPSATMLVAHALTVAGGALVVRGTDRAARRALGLLHRLLRADQHPLPPATRRWISVPSEQPLVARSAAARRHVLRGPPIAAAPALSAQPA